MEIYSTMQERCDARLANPKTDYYEFVDDEKDTKLSVLFSLLGLKSRNVDTVSPSLDKYGGFLDTYRDYDSLLQEAKGEAENGSSIQPCDESEAMPCRCDVTKSSDVLGVTFFCLAAKARSERISFQYNNAVIDSGELPDSFRGVLYEVLSKVNNYGPEEADARCQYFYEQLGIPKDFDIKLPIHTKKI